MTETFSTIRILIADDHRLFREGLRALLGSIPDTEVVGEAAGGEEAVAQAMTLSPDIVLMDIQMPGTNGIEATRRITRAGAAVKIIVLTMFEDDDSVFAAMRAGARGYILKGASQAEMLRAIRAVASGEALFGPAVADRLLDFFASGSSGPPPPFPDLTSREREILDLMAGGYDNADIADRLFLSPKTIRNHVSLIYGKLQVADRAQAIIRAREAGLGH